MNFKNLLVLTAVIAAGSPAYAQYASDALLFSQSQQGASSRFKAMGSAQTAVGGDIGSLSSNPAGLGLFTKSEFNFSADFSNRQTEAQYLGQNATAQKDRLGIDQVGVVMYNPTARTKGSDLKTGWLSFNYGVSYNKTNNFNTTTDYRGTNPTSSYADYLADVGNTEISESALTEMAFNNFLIENDAVGNTGYFPTTTLNNNQQNVVYRTGSQSEVNFGAGANYSNKLYLGASIAIASVDYNSDRQFMEQGNNQTFIGQNPNFAGGTYDLTYNSNQITTGSGFNAKIGMIYRATDAVRVGLGFTSPTWFQISDSFIESLDTRYTRANGSAIIPAYTNEPAVYDFEYTLRTPFRVNGGLSAIINKQGLLSADVEYVDYSSTHFKSSESNTDVRNNNDIRDSYKAAVNLRLGGEYKISNMMLRAGYNRIGNPYQSVEISTDILSAGIGFRSNLLYIDLTYQNATFNGTSTPYVISPDYVDYQITGAGEVANLNNKSNNVFVTIGARF